MIKSAIRLAFAICIVTGTNPAHAVFELGDLQPFGAIGIVPGNGHNDDVEIREVSLGLTHYFREQLGFSSELFAYRPDGTRDSLSVETGGLALTFGLRYHFFKRARFTSYLDWGAGFVVFSDPFPPGGTKFNGNSYFGLGLSLRLLQNLHLMTGVRQMHISNGKGLVEKNPSFDGFGGYVGLAAKPWYRPPVPPIEESPPFGGADLRLRADAFIDASDEEEARGGRLALDHSILPHAHLRAMVSYSAAELVDRLIWEATLFVYRETEAGRTAIGVSRQEFSVFTSTYLSAQLERAIHDITTLRAGVSYEDRNKSKDRLFGGLFLNVYPADPVSIRTGVGFERQEDELFDSIENLNDAGFNIGLEVSPWLMADLGLSATFDVGIGYDAKIAGIRYQTGGHRSLRDRHRSGTLVPLR